MTSAALADITATVARIRDARATLAALLDERDALIVQALAGGERPTDVARAAGLTRQQVNSVTNGDRR